MRWYFLKSLKGSFLLNFKVALPLLALLWPQFLQARVFSFDQESLAPYINFRGGISSLGNSPYQWQSAPSLSGDKVDLVYGGEFGFYFRGESLGVSVGLLVQTFDPITGGKGANASGTQLFSVDVEGMSYGPQITFDYQFMKSDMYMWKFLIGGGYLMSKLESTYNFTTTGQALVVGQSTLTESYKQEAPFVMLGLSTEFITLGTTTLTITAGYQYSLGSSWKYGQGGQNLAGVHVQGGPVQLENGTSKEMDLSYAFIQLGFNIYVDKVR